MNSKHVNGWIVGLAIAIELGTMLLCAYLINQ
jgi:hypothetical protein